MLSPVPLVCVWQRHWGCYYCVTQLNAHRTFASFLVRDEAWKRVLFITSDHYVEILNNSIHRQIRVLKMIYVNAVSISWNPQFPYFVVVVRHVHKNKTSSTSAGPASPPVILLLLLEVILVFWAPTLKHQTDSVKRWVWNAKQSRGGRSSDTGSRNDPNNLTTAEQTLIHEG